MLQSWPICFISPGFGHFCPKDKEKLLKFIWLSVVCVLCALHLHLRLTKHVGPELTSRISWVICIQKWQESARIPESGTFGAQCPWDLYFSLILGNYWLDHPLKWLTDHFFLLTFLLGLLVMLLPAVCGIRLKYQFQHYLMGITLMNEALAATVSGETRSQISMALVLCAGRMRKHLFSHGSQSLHCSPKVAFRFWVFIPAVFHFHLMSLCSGVK